MSDEDPIEHGLSVAMTGAASMSRVAEILIRQAQEMKARAATETRQQAEELALQLEARARVAEAFYREAATSEWLTSAKADEIVAAAEGVHAWADIDERFGSHAERMREQIQAAFGVDVREMWEEQKGAEWLADAADGTRNDTRNLAADAVVDVDAARSEETVALAVAYDAPEARAERAAGMSSAETELSTVKARTVADKLNAHDPRRTAGAAAAGKGRAPAKPAARSTRKTQAQQRGR